MVDDYNSIPKDDLEEIFVRIEMQAYDVSFNMVILMLSLDIDFGIFDDLGNSNLNVGFRGNLEEIMKQNH